jgi:tetratricopeptide (TPR) repeat protein
MDAGLAWTAAGTVACAAGVVVAVLQLRHERDETAASGKASGSSGEAAGSLVQGQVDPQGSHAIQVGSGNVMVNQFLTRPGPPKSRQAAELAVVGEIPQEPPGWRPRPELMAAMDAASLGPQVAVHAVTGMRGVGKTQLAAAYARVQLGQADGRLVAWVNADTPGKLLAGLAATAQALGKPPENTQADAQAARHWLEADGTGCLLILDNVTDPGLVQPYLPVAGAARVIITSNDQAAAELGTPVGVEVFTHDEGLAYLGQRTGLADAAGARQLGDELGWLPLALAQAAAVIAGQRLGYGAYLGRLRRMPVDMLLAPTPVGQYARSVASAILLSLEDAVTHDDTGMCERLMRLIALLSSSGVQRELVHAAAAGGLLAQGITAEAADETADRALARLARASLLTFSMDGSAVMAHRLVTRVIREQLSASGVLADACQAAASLLEARTESPDDPWHEHPGAAREVIEHITALQESAIQCPADSRLGEIMIKPREWAVWCLIQLGDNDARAVMLSEPLLADCERLLGLDDPDTLTARNDLANAYYRVGRLDEAIALHQQNLDDRERFLGADDPATLASRGNLATAYTRAGRIHEAINLHERNFADRERLLGTDHPDLLSSRFNLAGAYLHGRRIDEAISLYQSALDGCERLEGTAHRHTLLIRHRLANAYRLADRTDEAIDLHERNLADQERILGAEHPDTAATREDLAVTYQAAGRTPPGLL